MIFVLLGNGFDLAHGLKTTYKDFMEFIVNVDRKTDDAYKDFLETKELKDFASDCSRAYSGPFAAGYDFSFKLFQSMRDEKWSDIEVEYFKSIESGDIKKINESFERLKLLLQYYLSIEETKVKNPLPGLSTFLRKRDVRAISFNYTKTLEHYMDPKSIYYLHGKLFSEDNPIIFGYAATNEDIQKYSRRGRPEYLWNFKKMCYHQTNTFNRLIKYSTPYQGNSNELWICGHSCGVSDTLILKELIEHDNIARVRIMYYESRDNFRLNQISLYSILDSDILFDKLQPFNRLFRMPQFDDNIDDPFIKESYELLSDMASRIDDYCD